MKKCDICGETRIRCHQVRISSSISNLDRTNTLCCNCTAKLEMWFEGRNIPYGLHNKCNVLQKKKGDEE